MAREGAPDLDAEPVGRVAQEHDLRGVEDGALGVAGGEAAEVDRTAGGEQFLGAGAFDGDGDLAVGDVDEAVRGLGANRGEGGGDAGRVGLWSMEQPFVGAEGPCGPAVGMGALPDPLGQRARRTPWRRRRCRRGGSAG